MKRSKLVTVKFCVRLALLIVIFAAAITVTATYQNAVAKPAPSPSPSPTNPPTPYMAPEAVTNGWWDIIMQALGQDPSYSTMKLTDVGDTVTGVWIADKRTKYNLNGKRDGKHLLLDISSPSKPDAAIGKIDAEIDGIADIVGTITLGKVETPFQGAQHSRVPPPLEVSPAPNATRTPY
jgi:hypothetical protein